MTIKFSPIICVLLFALPAFCAACAGNVSVSGGEEQSAEMGHNKEPSPGDSAMEIGQSAKRSISLEQIAEIERAGASFPGLGLTESGLREEAGDYAGAVIAAYKELSWAYALGIISRDHVEEGLLNGLAAFEASSQEDGELKVKISAIKGCLAFRREEWNEAEQFLNTVLPENEEPDSFLRWMLLVCALEKENGVSENIGAVRSAYGAIRARYSIFPEYWYRAARSFYGVSPLSDESYAGTDLNIAAAHAEQCINVSPNGPFAQESRRILAAHLGISPDESGDISAVLSMAEIEKIIRSSVSANRPKMLEELFPLMSLPDNPYTLFAVGAMRALASVPEFKTFFMEEALKSQGRLGERLNYISRG